MAWRNRRSYLSPDARVKLDTHPWAPVHVGKPDVAVPNTAGRPGAYTGSYGQVRLDWTIDRQTSVAVEAVHFVIGDALRNAGGHDSNYLGVDIKRGW